jgi:leucyl aminopeptidase
MTSTPAPKKRAAPKKATTQSTELAFAVKSQDVTTQISDCLILTCDENLKGGSDFAKVDAASAAQLSQMLAQEAFKGKAGQSLLLLGDYGIKAKRILVIGTGKNSPQDFRTAFSCIHDSLKKTTVSDLVISVESTPNSATPLNQQARIAAECLGLIEHRPGQLKSIASDASYQPQKITLLVAKTGLGEASEGLAQGHAISRGVNLARHLGDMPANICTPTYLAECAQTLGATSKKLTVEILDEKKMKALKMGSLLSVSAGSDQPAKLIVMQYNGGNKKSAPIALVGKGVTFDTGGISLKPGAGMDEMKYDMCGAASVLGAFKALVDLQLPINVVGVIAATENMPSGSATKPGDVVTSMSGQTIEILNTDAEGRLVLCDALTYTERFKPKAVVDIATLTGACVIALGAHATGLFSNNDELAQALLAAGNTSHDRAWQMPIWDEYQKQLDSNFADIANIGGREAGSVTAACFLSRFTKNMAWAHLDVAGTAWKSGAAKGATGRPVGLLVQYLLDQAAA